MPDYYKDSDSERLFQQRKNQETPPNPHIRSNDETIKIMGCVVLALLPAVLFSGYLFGLKVYDLFFIALATAFAADGLWSYLVKRPFRFDLSIVVTALLLTMNLPPTAPWYFPVIGVAFAVIIVKEFFGGIGYNFLNPALGGRALLIGLFYNQMFLISWPDPPFGSIAPDVVSQATANDVVSGATPLAVMKAGETLSGSELVDAFLGFTGGRIGETSALLLLLGGIFLVYKKIISPRIPLIIFATIGLFAFILGPEGLFTGSWQTVIGHIISGGAMLGAIYMATDYSSTPGTKAGENLFALGVGLLVVLFRFFGFTNEGMSYAILIMNCFTPLIDRFLRLRILGEGKKTPFNLKIMS